MSSLPYFACPAVLGQAHFAHRSLSIAFDAKSAAGQEEQARGQSPTE